MTFGDFISYLHFCMHASIRRAVTTEEAKLDLQEQQWLGYLAGGFLSKVKKTQDQRYYA